MKSTCPSESWPAPTPLFREVWDLSLDAMALSDARGVVVFANQACLKLFAHAPATVIGQDVTLFFPESEREPARAAYQAAFQVGRPVDRVEALIRCGDGTFRTVEARLSFVSSEGARYMLSVVRDIQAFRDDQAALAAQARTLEARIAERTAQLAETVQELLEEVSVRARVETELKSILRLQQAMLDSASYAIIATGLDGMIRSFNPAAERMLGCAAAEVIGRVPLVSFYDPEELQAYAANLGRAAGAGPYLPGDPRTAAAVPPYEAEWTFRRPDGTTIPVAVSLTVLRDEEGLPEGFLSIVSDISERMATETALLQANAELAQLNRLKDEFLANMSHELRTPLNAILGRAEVLLEQIHGPLSERQLRSIHSIEESGRDLLALINDILDIAKIESGRIQLEYEPCDVALICNASMRLVAEVAQKKHVAIKLQIEADQTAIVADQRRLKQILVNLLSNAVKFTPPGGTVGLEVRGASAGAEMSFVVWDTGIGIAPEDQARLFQPFVQIDSSLSRQYAGTGLGLSLVHRLTVLHGGQVDLESAPGKGSRFTITLPRDVDTPEPGAGLAEPVPLAPDPAPASPLSGRPLVLIVDDSRQNIELVQEYLESLGYRVVITESGSEAVELAAALVPSIVLMDIQLPGVDGLEAIRRMRARPETTQIPIVAFTALAMAGDRERCLAAGANAYLSKPVSLRELAVTIASYTGLAPTTPRLG